MLCLSRKKNESIIFTLEDGRKITVMVVEIRGDKVRLGATADKTIHIRRDELDPADGKTLAEHISSQQRRGA